jgi:peroxisomal 3,2-trans-enoyl-CoA isomerase
MQRAAFLMRCLRSSDRAVGLTAASSACRSLPVRLFASSSNQFDHHVQLVTRLSADPGNEDKLQLYGLFKQATEGPNKKAKPGALDFVGKYKWQAWADLGQMTQQDAQAAYIKKVQELASSIGLTQSADTSSPSASADNSSTDQSLVITIDKSVKTIRFNRPSKKNAFTPDMYSQITDEINQASKDNQIKAVILTGTG